MANQHTSQLTPDDTLAAWYEDVKAGRRTYAQIAAETGMSRDAVKGRVEKWRIRVGHVQAAQAPPPPAEPQEADAEVLFPDLKVRGDEEQFADDYLELVIRQQALEDSQDNEQDVAHAEIRDTRPCMVVFTGDWHLGNRGTDHALLREYLRLIRETDGVYMGGMGDYADWFIGRMARLAPTEQQYKPKEQRALARDLLLRKTGGKALWLLAGNHCWKPEELTGEDPVADIAAEARVPYLGYGGVVYVRLAEVEYKLGVWHSYPGWSSINLGNNNRRLRADYEGLDANCFGHYHVNYRQDGTTKEGHDYIDLRSGSLKVRDRRWAAQKAGAKGGDPRMPGLILWPSLRDDGRKHMLAERDFRDLLDYLAYLRGE